MDNYYTPTSDEFHIGFIYSKLEVRGNDLLEDEWIEYTMDSLEEFSPLGMGCVLNELINDGFIRVKLLDEEDIQSLGFSYNYFDKDGRSYNAFVKNNIGIKYYYNNPNEYQIYQQLNSGQRILFDGIIKNKSELKRILTQLVV
jgi:hypothetical protein